MTYISILIVLLILLPLQLVQQMVIAEEINVNLVLLYFVELASSVMTGHLLKLLPYRNGFGFTILIVNTDKNFVFLIKPVLKSLVLS